MNYTSITLGELLSSENETIKRNAVSILKVLQKGEDKRCWAQVGEDWCNNKATHGDYCNKHYQEFNH